MDAGEWGFPGIALVHRVSVDHLGSSWVALDQRQGSPGEPVLLRRVQWLAGATAQAAAAAGDARGAVFVEHENVLPVRSVAWDGPNLVITHDLAVVESLCSLQLRARERGSAVPVGVALSIAIGALRGVEAVHDAMRRASAVPLLGSLSPEGVLVASDGRILLCDPVIASRAAPGAIDVHPAALAYRAPEQLRSTSELAASVDVFAVAAMLFELLVGEPLLSGSREDIEHLLLTGDLRELTQRLSGDGRVASRLADLVRRSLSADPSERPATPGVLALQLERCGHDLAPSSEVAGFASEVAGEALERQRLALAERLASSPTDSALLPRSTGWSQRPRSGPVSVGRPGPGVFGFWTAIALGVIGAAVAVLRWSDLAALWQPSDPRGASSGVDAGRSEVSARSRDAGLAARDAGLPAAPPSPEAYGRVLSDPLFLELFALEPRNRAPACEVLLGASASRHAGNDPDKSRSRLDAARRQIADGHHDQARRLLCSATAHFPGNAPAWRLLAELSLWHGDPSRARREIERALQEKPHDRRLLGILGDVSALSGDLERSRTLWRRSAKMGGRGALRERLLAELFARAGDRELRAGRAPAALSQYRRAVVLSAGAEAPSRGMRDALNRLGHERAAGAWEERIRRAFAREVPEVSAVGEGVREGATTRPSAPVK